MDSALQPSSITKPASPAAIGAAIAAATDRIEQIPIAKIHPSPNNPRKTFEGIEELAASIAEQGLLQPIVVRPMKKDGEFEILAGERRFRALKHLKRDTAPCKVAVASDGQARAIQIVENLQRDDIAPLEEAAAFQALQDHDPKTWTPQAIAKAVGKSDRFVQQRLAIARNLSPKGKALLGQGRLKVEGARALAMAPTRMQLEILEQNNWRVDKLDANLVTALISERAIPESKAAFDVKLYDGDWIESDGKRLFADVAKFDVLQEAAAQKRVKKLREEWPDAQLHNGRGLHAWVWADTGENLSYSSSRKGGKADGKLKVAKDKCTALVWVDAHDHRIVTVQGVCKASLLEKKTRSSSSGSMPARTEETAEHKAARRAFNAEARAAAMKKPELVKRLVLLNLLSAEVDEVAEDAIEAVKKTMPAGLGKYLGRYLYGGDIPAVWKTIKDLKPATLDDAIAQVATCIVSWDEYDEKPPAHVADIASALGVKFVEPQKAEAPKETAKPKPAKKKAAAARKKHQ